MRHRAKVDANQREIVEVLRAMGIHVEVLADVGGGIPDLLCICRSNQFVFFAEVKDGAKPPSARKLTQSQQKFAAAWHSRMVLIKDADAAIAAARWAKCQDEALLPPPGLRCAL